MSDYLFPWYSRYHNRINGNSIDDYVYCGKCGTTGRRYSCECGSYEKVKLDATNARDANLESRGKGHLHD